MSDVSKEKRAELIQDALGYLDDDMLENVDKLRMGAKRPIEKVGNLKRFRSYSTRYLAVAASVCLLVMGAFAWENLIGPPEIQDGVLRGTESADENHWEPEKAPALPGMNEDMEQEKEEETGDVEENQPTEGEGNKDSIITDTELIGLPDDSTGEESDEPDHYPPMGDAYQLTDNYVKVTMLPNKVWHSEETVKENFANSREIEAKYYDKIDKFIEELCETPLLEIKMVMDAWPSVGDTDMYHLFFQRCDGEIVQVCILSDYGCVYFYDKQEYCMKIDGDILYEVMKVLWVHW